MTLTGSPCGLLAAAAEGGRPRAGSPTIDGGSPDEWRAAIYAGRGSGPRRSRASSPSRTLPTRRPGTNWIPGRDTPANYSISVLDRAGNPVESLIGWPVARLADEHAQTLPDIAGYRVVPLRRVNGP
ncbi:hypothetical protein [Frankia sp. CcWB2]